ncbi:MAG: ATP-binding cassette domain-containing protein [Clostridium sp.]|uniref:ABC transporter ATP-binding protein n=1 Tax=Clostridium sp. TaxID=1506 RepID=UPI003F2B5B14
MGIVEIKNVTKRFKDKLVLDNVSYEVNAGEIFGFIGPNGAGKSTLINIMTSILVPDSGTILINGFDIQKESIKAKECIGYVPQDLALLENLNAYDNLEFFGALSGLSGKLLKERIKEALSLAGLTDKRKEKVKKFSGGMKRRLNIAVGILNHPKVLILDEPTVGVDPQSRNHIFSFIKKIRDEWGTTVIYTSHYMEEVEELCSRVFIMDLGREVSYGTKEEIKKAVFSNDKVILKQSGMDASSIMKLKEEKTIIDILENEDEVTLTVTNDFKLGATLNLLENSGVTVRRVSYEEAKLEDVFLRLTGKNLRD